MRIARFEVAVLCLGSALGSGVSAAIPLWVAATIKSGSLSTPQIGWLASGELFSTAISSLAASAWARRESPRMVAAVAASVAVAANIVAMLPAAYTLVIGRLISGLATGALLAAVTGVAARRQDAQRVLALMQAGMVLLLSLIFFVSPGIIGRFGPAGLFAIFAGVGVIMSVAALISLPAETSSSPVATRVVGALKLAPILGSLALGVMALGQGTVWIYIVAIGNGLGLNAPTMGVVLAIVLPLAMLGPIAAYRLGERVGLVRPLIFGLVAMGVDAFFLVAAASPILFCITTSALDMTMLFCVPYAISLLSRLEPAGRFASAAPAFMTIGGAMAPALGSKLAGTARFEALAAVSASCMALSIVLFSAAAHLAHAEDVAAKRRPNSLGNVEGAQSRLR
jgi:predicted MFS family arabinose efflux permease